MINGSLDDFFNNTSSPKKEPSVDNNNNTTTTPTTAAEPPKVKEPEKLAEPPKTVKPNQTKPQNKIPSLPKPYVPSMNPVEKPAELFKVSKESADDQTLIEITYNFSLWNAPDMLNLCKSLMESDGGSGSGSGSGKIILKGLEGVDDPMIFTVFLRQHGLDLPANLIIKGLAENAPLRKLIKSTK